MSDDPKQEYFADGMTDDLITDLSKIAGLFVIARNSVFTYKGKSVKVKQIGRDLGVRYVLEGSVRKVDNQVRINAQLIDTTTGGHLWAERYDGEMDNIFDLQDKINQKIISALAVKLTVGEKALVGQKGTNDPAAYEELLKGRVHYLRNTTEDFTKAEACFKRAIQLDPNYGQARAALAMLYWFAAQQRKEAAFKISYVEARLRARQYLREAMKEPTSIAYQVGGVMDLNLRQHDEAISQLEKALTLDPNDPACLAAMSRVLSYSGRPAEGLEYAKDAMRLDPLNPGRYLAYMGIAYFCMGEWQETVTVIEKALKLNPELRAFAGYLASAYAHLGRDDESKAAAQTFRRGSPLRHTVDALPPARRWMFFYPFKDRGVADSFLESLKRVGLLAPGPEYIHVSKKDQLTGAELRAFYCPSTITGLSARDGSVWSEETTKGGTSTYRANFVPGGVDTGKKWFEGDKVWIQYSKILFGMAFCVTTFKNPRGTHEGKDEYVRVSDIAMTPFSRVR
jgi:TolB-like protein/Flp pilus assembly protein TadD